MHKYDKRNPSTRKQFLKGSMVPHEITELIRILILDTVINGWGGHGMKC